MVISKPLKDNAMAYTISLSIDLDTWDTTFTNGVPFYRYVLKPSLSIRTSLKLGKLDTNSMKLTVDAPNGYAEQFIGYQYVKVTKDNSILFVGTLVSANKRVDDLVYSRYDITYKDLSHEWTDAYFCDNPRTAYMNSDPLAHDIGNIVDSTSTLETLAERRDYYYNLYHSTTSKYYGNTVVEAMYVAYLTAYNDVVNNLGSGEYVWQLPITEADSYTICNPSDTSHSLVHKIASYLPFYNKLTVNATCTKSDVVKAFKATCTKTINYSGEYLSTTEDDENDKVLDVLLDVCKQNGIAVSLNGFILTFSDFLSQSGTATTVTEIEQNATKAMKPYQDTSSSNIAYCNEVITFHPIDSEVFSATGSIEGQTYYPSKDEGLASMQLNDSNAPVDCELFATTIESWVCKRTKSYLKNGTWVLSNPTLVESKAFGDKAYFRIKATNPDTKQDWKVIAKGYVTYTKFNKVLRTGGTWNGDIDRCEYIYAEDTARDYDLVSRWYKEAESQYWKFSTTQDLALGQLVSLSGISSDVLIIMSKTISADDFGSISYTASKVIDSSDVSFDVDYTSPNTAIEENWRDKVSLEISRPYMFFNWDGTLVDNSVVRILVATNGTEPALTFGGTVVTLEQRYLQDDTSHTRTMLNEWVYEWTPTTTATYPISVVASTGTDSASGQITRTDLPDPHDYTIEAKPTRTDNSSTLVCTIYRDGAQFTEGKVRAYASIGGATEALVGEVTLGSSQTTATFTTTVSELSSITWRVEYGY